MKKRWFASSASLLDDHIQIDGDLIPIGAHMLYQHAANSSITFGIEICEDLWTPTPPSGPMAIAGATLIFNPSASNDLVGKSDYRKSLVSNQSARTMTGYIYASTGYGESTTDIVFGGQCMIYENGTLLKENRRFQLDGSLTFADVDIERLQNDRHKMVTYADMNTLHSPLFKKNVLLI